MRKHRWNKEGEVAVDPAALRICIMAAPSLRGRCVDFQIFSYGMVGIVSLLQFQEWYHHFSNSHFGCLSKFNRQLELALLTEIWKTICRSRLTFFRLFGSIYG
jgi:hypothetical protein